MTEIILPILFNPEGSETLTELGLPIPDTDFEIKHMVFYSISALQPYQMEHKMVTRIFIPGNDFLCDLSIDDVREKIRSAYSYNCTIQIPEGFTDLWEKKDV